MLIQPHKINKAHRDKPRLPVSSVKYRRRAVLESLGVPLGLVHCFGYIQPLHALDLDMDAGEAGQVRHFPEALGAASLDLIAVFPEDRGKLPLTISSFAL